MSGIFGQLLDAFADVAAALAATESKLDAVLGALTTSPVLASETTLEGNGSKLDAILTAQGQTTAQLAAIDGHVDGLEGFVDGLEGLLAALGATSDLSTALTLVGLLKAVKASLAGTLVVDFPAGATPTAIVDGATATASRYIGITVHETTGSAGAVVRVRNNNAAGTILDAVSLLPNESVSLTYPRGRAAASGTVYIQIAAGAVEGSVFT